MSVTFFKVPFTHLTQKSVVAAVVERTSERQYTKPLTVFTPNVEQLMQTRENRDFLKDLKAADITFPDSVGLVWGDWWRAAVTGRAWMIRERVPGVDVAERLLSEAVERGWKVAVAGGAGNVSELAVAYLKKRFDGLQIKSIPVGRLEMDVGYELVEDDLTQAAIERIKEMEPDLLLVGLGAPKQERWVLKHREELATQVAMVVGGAVDMWAGKITRAPGWWQKAGLEWLYRLMREPWRWQRQLRLVRFAGAVLTYRDK